MSSIIVSSSAKRMNQLFPEFNMNSESIPASIGNMRYREYPEAAYDQNRITYGQQTYNVTISRLEPESAASKPISAGQTYRRIFLNKAHEPSFLYKIRLPDYFKLGINVPPGESSDIAEAWRVLRLAFNSNRIVAALSKQASRNLPFGKTEVLLLKQHASTDCDEGRAYLLNEVRNSQTHGRVRWLLLEIVAQEQDEHLRELLVELLQNESDPWVLMGASIVCRFTKMGDHRSELAAAFRRLLTKAKNQPSWGGSIRASVLGEILLTAGAFAEPQDINLLGSFVLKDSDRKPRINACDALARTIRRHLLSSEVDQFYRANQEELRTLGLGLAKCRYSSDGAGAILFGVMQLVLARLGSEGALVLDICAQAPELAVRARWELKRTEQVLIRRGEDAWLESRREDISYWRERLEQLVEAA